jgi:urease accessory protein
MGLVGFFAIFHGHAHGAEMPMDVSAAGYGAGFVLATSILHAVGIVVGIAVAQIGDVFAPRITQFSGAAIAMAGVAILGGVL